MIDERLPVDPRKRARYRFFAEKFRIRGLDDHWNGGKFRLRLPGLRP
jgi:hypothetical protein